ncbi:Ribosome-binding factor A [hydrothermal vent metagenome]|uniref:Ribosome-binding factor A n=1 Tax=hydrothermal vent metagenome TaxID=652676 RepID=A0A1W1D2Z9_9ZZZZ
MTEAQIKLKRTESILEELIPEALGSMNDTRLHQLAVTEVKVSRGKSDAKVFIDPNGYSLKEQQEYLKLLKKARPIVETYCLKDQGWYRCPKLSFEFDHHIGQVQKIEELFKQIAKDNDES